HREKAVMAGLVPAIHDFDCCTAEIRGCQLLRLGMTEFKVRLGCLWSGVVRVNCLWSGVVRIDESAAAARLSLALDVPHDLDFGGLAHNTAKHDLRGRLRPARIGEKEALLDHGLGRV